MYNISKNATFTAVLLLLLLPGVVFSICYREKPEQVQTENREKRKNMLAIARKITLLAKDIRIATGPSPCDALTREIVGDSCDIGNYMEWAGPHLENETARLHRLLSDSER